MTNNIGTNEPAYWNRFNDYNVKDSFVDGFGAGGSFEASKIISVPNHMIGTKYVWTPGRYMYPADSTTTAIPTPAPWYDGGLKILETSGLFVVLFFIGKWILDKACERHMKRIWNKEG